VLAVVAGTGMRRLFESLGAAALDGGKTLNPSTYELLAGIHEVPAEEVVVLPNSANVIMAAERAAELSDKHVIVVPTRSQQAGLTAAVALEPSRRAEDVAAAMRDAIVELRIGSVAPAGRDDVHGRFVVGDAVGFVEDEIIAWGDAEATLRTVLGSLGRDAELVTCISGEGAPIADDAVEALAPDGVELDSQPRRAARLLVAAGRPSDDRLTGHTARVAPTAFASSDPLDADGCRRAPAARRAAARAARGQARGRRRRGRGARAAHGRGPAPAPPARERRGADDQRAAARVTATVLVEVRGITSRPVRRRGMKPLVEATVMDATGRHEGDVLQPAVARAPVPPSARG
jgi:hypothetical protein